MVINKAVTSQSAVVRVFKFDISISAADTANIETKLTTRQIIALEPNQQSYRILIVDDEAPNRDLLEGLVESFGHDPVTASSGAEALLMLSPDSGSVSV